MQVLPNTPVVSKENVFELSCDIDPQRKKLEEWQKANGRLRPKTPISTKKPLTQPQPPQITRTNKKPTTTTKRIPDSQQLQNTQPQSNVVVLQTPIITTTGVNCMETKVTFHNETKKPVVKEERREGVIDFDLLSEFMERFYPRLKPNDANDELYVKCKEAIGFDYGKSKEFFCPIYDNPNSELKNYAFFWLSWAESLFKLASFDGVKMALSQAVKHHAEPYDVVTEYISEYFPKKCKHCSQMLKLGLNIEDCPKPPNLDTRSSDTYDILNFTPANKFIFDLETSKDKDKSNTKPRHVIAATPSKFSSKSLGNPQRVPIDYIKDEDGIFMKNLDDTFTNSKEFFDRNEFNESSSDIKSVESTPSKIEQDSIPQTPKLKVEISEEQVNPVDYLQSTYPTLGAQNIIQLCQAMQSEDQLENIKSEDFQAIDVSKFDKEDLDTRNALRRYSFVKFTKSSLYNQLRILSQQDKYSNYFGLTTLPRSQDDPTPVRRSKRLEQKTPAQKTPWRN